MVLVLADERKSGAPDLGGDAEQSNADRLESLFATTFHQGNGGTKVEAKGLIVGDGPGQMGKSTFYRAWNQLTTARHIVRITGSQSWQWIPPEDRAGP